MLRNTLAVALVIAAISPAFAAETPRVDQMEARQRERIEQGVTSGQLTAPETHRLVYQERQLDRHEARVKSDGEVTQAERYRLNQDAMRTSRHIHRQRHDTQTRH
jgi:hypothetical protein